MELDPGFDRDRGVAMIKNKQLTEKLEIVCMILVLWCVALFFSSCCCQRIIHPIGPPEPTDAGTLEDCGPACENLARLQCPGWRGSPGADEIWGTADDYSCETACRNIMYADDTATLFPICTAAAQTCEEVEKCFFPGNAGN